MVGASKVSALRCDLRACRGEKNDKHHRSDVRRQRIPTIRTSAFASEYFGPAYGRAASREIRKISFILENRSCARIGRPGRLGRQPRPLPLWRGVARSELTYSSAMGSKKPCPPTSILTRQVFGRCS